MRLSLAFVIAAAASMFGAAPTGAAVTLDQSQTSDNAGAECLCEPVSRLAQTFTAGITGNLYRLDLLLYRIGQPGDLTVELRTASAGAPLNATLSSATVAEAIVPEGAAGWVSVFLDEPAVTAGMQYAIVVSASGVSGAAPLYAWGAALGDPYAGGDLLTSVDGGASWFPLIGSDGEPLDRTFKTFVATDGGDVSPPTMLTPAALQADATSPVGASVGYSVTAVDDGDPDPAVTCVPPSSSAFPIGDTIVTCKAADRAGNEASASFVVHVRGAAEQLEDLASVVTGIGPGTSLANKVADARTALDAGKRTKACEILGAFRNEVTAQSGESISEVEAAELLATAARIRAVLAC